MTARPEVGFAVTVHGSPLQRVPRSGWCAGRDVWAGPKANPNDKWVVAAFVAGYALNLYWCAPSCCAEVDYATEFAFCHNQV